eukprot:6747932-Alexandrium_andersonii.AAC.1
MRIGPPPRRHPPRASAIVKAKPRSGFKIPSVGYSIHAALCLSPKGRSALDGLDVHDERSAARRPPRAQR